MIDNEYVCELNLDLDYSILRQLATEAKIEDSLLKHQRRVEHYTYLKAIKSKYPILGNLWNIYTFSPNTGLDTHIDIGRSVTLNIPLEGTEDSITRFYNFPDCGILNYKKSRVPERALDTVNSECTEVFNFTLLKPAIIKTSVPHSVLAGSTYRKIISWSIPEMSFEDAKSYFKSMGVC